MPKLHESDITGKITCHNVPEVSGVYLITDLNGEVLYVGHSDCLRRRIAYLESGTELHTASRLLINYQSKSEKAFAHWIICENYKARERQLKQKYNPPWNKK
ncbi:hypothetical protein LCGC14_0885140 [marine sediment metagenome]|uniref:GIY-YIG domain-containing protein n=1 Tax=marine sediment metagenome TaxID=412755 RepID=A0A0F9P5R4_9ZZZZ